MVRVVPGGVQDADAHGPVGVDVRVEEFALEPHRGGGEGVVGGESERGGEYAPRVGGAVRAGD